MNQKRIEQIETYLQGEVEVYDEYLQKQVYGFQVEKDGEINEDDVLDSCWGFYGYDHRKSGLLDEAESTIDYLIREELDKHGIQEKMELV